MAACRVHLGDKRRSQVNCYSSRCHPAPFPLASPSHNQGSALDRSINLFLHSYASLPCLPFCSQSNFTLVSDPHRVERQKSTWTQSTLWFVDRFSHSFFWTLVDSSLSPCNFSFACELPFFSHTSVIVIALLNAQSVFPYPIILVLDMKYIQVLILGLACFNMHFCFSSLFSWPLLNELWHVTLGMFRGE